MKQAFVEKRFEYKGYPCVVILPASGYRCGYVGLTSGSSFYQKEYGNIDVSCHGGLTYSEPDLFEQNDENTWWIGFDCGHYFDAADYQTLRMYADDAETLKYISFCESTITSSHCGIVRTLSYVERECMRIVDQLIKLEKKHDEEEI